MENKVINMLWSSDHHTLHNKTPTTHILNNMTDFHMVSNNLANQDLVMFGGDLLDRLVDNANPEFVKVLDWMDNFLTECEKYGVVVRFLEGTSSHDWGQQKHIRHNLLPKLNSKYIDQITVEVIEELNGLSILYVPDNLSGTYSPDQIWELALEELAKHDMVKVDIVAMHGGFTVQLPKPAWRHAHLLERWKTIVKYCIFAGHIHTPYQDSVLKTGGSFDRTRHGEEHPKGALVAKLDQTKEEIDVRFWENKNALPYCTLQLDPELSIEETIKLIYGYIKNKRFPPHSQIKFSGGLGHVINPIVNTLTSEYPLLGFSAENINKEDQLVDEDMYDNKVYEGVSINKENIHKTLFPEVEDVFVALNVSEKEVKSVLKEFL